MVQENEADLARLRQAYTLCKTDPGRAFKEYRALAEKGSPHSMLQLAWAYWKGIGTAIDLTQAEMWYRRAYEIGPEQLKKKVTYYLGWVYLLQNNNLKAYEISSAGAAMNYAPAVYRLGCLYRDGLGVEKQPDQAYLLFERAAALGHLLAKRNLALQLMSGRFGLLSVFKGFFLLLRSVKEIFAVKKKALHDEREDERVMA